MFSCLGRPSDHNRVRVEGGGEIIRYIDTDFGELNDIINMIR